ncbi:Surface antigen [bacterium A37T11]|nr:Surface antigen [bacterium A37T11]
MYKHSIVLLLVLLLGIPAKAQKKLLQSKLVQRFISSKKDSTRSAGFVLLPVLGSAPETGLEFGLAGIYNFYVDKTDPTIRTSSTALQTSFTTKSQFDVKLTTDIWTKKNEWHYLGEIRFRNFPFNFYGLGDQTLDQDKDILRQRLFRIRAEAEKKWLPHYYGGLVALFENYTYQDKEAGGIFDKELLQGKSGGHYIALGISQLYDSRNTNTYTTKGFYARGRYTYSPNLWGGQNFSGSHLDGELRAFFPLTPTLTLGLNSEYQTYFNKAIPFYLTPQLGYDEMMRGYYQGRYRDNNFLAAQAELRWRFHPRLGLAAFAATGTVYPKTPDLTALKGSFGGGLRYFFDLEHNSSIRVDYGVGEKRPGEKRQTGLYLSLGEAF